MMTSARSLGTVPGVVAPLPAAPPWVVASALCVLGATQSFAQAVVNPQVNPGVVQSQDKQNEAIIRQQNEQTLVGPPIVPVQVPKTPVGLPGGKTFRLKAVEFGSSAFITKDELDRIAAPYLGKDVDISDIQKIVRAVNDIYAERGYVTASAILPPQTLKDGILHVSLIEGKLEKVETKGTKRLDRDFVVKHVQTSPGEVVDVPELTREVAAFNKTGVAQIQASLQPGSSFGLTTIDLAVVEPPALSVSVFGDNEGFQSVNQYEGGFLIQGYSPLHVDDRLTFYGVGSQGNLDGNVAYSLPFDYTGGRVGASYTQGQIFVVKGPFANLGITGRSDIISGNAVQPVFVNSQWSLLLNAAVAQYTLTSRQMTAPTVDNTTDKYTGGFSIGFQNDKFAASIAPTVSFAYTSFDLIKTDQSFTLGNATFNASYRLPLGFLATLGGAVQLSSRNVISGDQLFQLGGPTTVRGYPTALYASGTGYYSNLELHHASDGVPGLDGFIFYDRGSTYGGAVAVTTLESVGAGFSYDFKDRIITEVSLGVPLDRVVTDEPSLEAYFRVTAKFNSNDLTGSN